MSNTETTRAVTAQLSIEQHKWLRIAAAKRGISMAEMVRDLVERERKGAR